MFFILPEGARKHDCYDLQTSSACICSLCKKMIIIIGILTFHPLMVKVRICGCVSAVWERSYEKAGSSSPWRTSAAFKEKKKILVFRITTTVFHIAPFVYVCAGANVFVGLCV